MAYFPSSSAAIKMVLEALKTHAPKSYAKLEANGTLRGFATDYAELMREEMLERWDIPRGRADERLVDRLRSDRDAIDLAVYSVIDEFLNAETLRAETLHRADR